MGWLWGDTFDHYTDLLLKYPATNAGISIGAGGGRFGTNSLRTGTGSGGWVRLAVTPGGSWAGGQVAFALVWLRLVEAPTNEMWLLNIAPSAVASHVAVTIGVDGSLSLWTFTGSQAPTSLVGGTRVGTTSPGLITPVDWHLVELKALIDSELGTLALRVNGSVRLSLSELATANPDGGVGWTMVHLGASGVSGSPSTDFDLFVVCDGVGQSDWLGIERADVLRPTGAGVSTQWTPSAGANYACVDDVSPDGDATAVSGPTVGLRDTYTHPALTTVDDIQCVQIVTVGKNPGTIARAIAHSMRTGSGADHDDPVNKTLTTIYKAQVSAWPEHPDTKAPWSVENVNGMQFGQKVTV